MAIQGQPFYGGLQIRANGNPIIVNGLVVNIYVDGNYEGQAAQGIVTAQGQFLPTTNTIGMTYTLPGLSVGTHAVTFVFLGNAQYASSSETLTFIIEAAPTPTPTPNANRNPNGDPRAGSHSQISESRVAGVRMVRFGALATLGACVQISSYSVEWITCSVSIIE
ncbi:MAG: Ig-like domain-containing protein [Halobacteriota archaeon]